MAVQILSQSYGPRKPLISCTADSLSDLAGLVCAEGSTATVGGTEYVLDRVNGWIEPGSGGGGSGVLVVSADTATGALDKTWREIREADFAVFAAHTGISGGKMFLPCLGALQVKDQHGEVTYNVYFLQTVPRAGDAACVVVEAVTDSEDGYPAITH